MMRWIVVMYFMTCSVALAAQQDYRIQGVVLEDSTLVPLEGARVVVKGTSFQTNTDENGTFIIDVSNIPLEVVLVVQLLGFSEKEVAVNLSSKQELVIPLVTEWLELIGPTIHAVRVETVWSSEQLNVADFAFADEGLLLLTYEKEDRWKRDTESKETYYSGCEVRFISSTGSTETSCTVPEEATGMYTDYFSEAFLEGKKNVYAVSIQSNVPELSIIDREDFENSYRPVIDTIGTKTILSSYNPDYPAFEYYAFNTTDSSVQLLRYMVDEEMMRMFRSEFKYLHPRDKLAAFRYELKTGIDKEIVAAYMSGFQNSNYYEPLNAPMIVQNDTLLIFDHHHDKLLKYDSHGQAIDSLLIQYHKVPKPERWSGKVMKDISTDDVYTYYNRNGFTVLKHIDTKTGVPSESFELYHRYAEKIKIRDGWVYYIYRPFESSQKRFLYKERM
ncbi:MAG: carboxypeptidase-like regulatory domain-containing protein [Flavobacteriales bacterium]|nr:carboxypeptidase-like regulatory domain-containing protein [Flavobacteriales bacterium]